MDDVRRFPIDDLDPRWRRFEKLVARMQATLAPDSRVIHDDKILGRQNGQTRQIDVSLRTTVAATEILIVVQCKDYANSVDVNDVGTFASVVEDVQAAKGVMVAVNGYTQAAKDLAKAKSID